MSRQNEHFYHLLNFSNAASARYEEVTVETEDIFGTPLESVTGYRFLPQAPEVFTYDADGNLLSDGRWNYTWDADEARQREDGAPQACPKGCQDRVPAGRDWQQKPLPGVQTRAELPAPLPT